MIFMMSFHLSHYQEFSYVHLFHFTQDLSKESSFRHDGIIWNTYVQNTRINFVGLNETFIIKFNTAVRI